MLMFSDSALPTEYPPFLPGITAQLIADQPKNHLRKPMTLTLKR